MTALPGLGRAAQPLRAHRKGCGAALRPRRRRRFCGVPPSRLCQLYPELSAEKDSKKYKEGLKKFEVLGEALTLTRPLPLTLPLTRCDVFSVTLPLTLPLTRCDVFSEE